VPAELSNYDAARSVVDSVVARAGQIDALVHLVGGFAGGQAVADTDDSTLNEMLDVNLKSAFYIFKAGLQHMRGRGAGRIIAIGSRAAVESNANAGAYSASKAALVALIRAIASENAESGITANIILPGTMDTPANRKAMPGADVKKWVQPDQVATLIVSLASDELSQVNGAAIPIYGRDI
jgi:NAD(P)-dependent dehydrogenase (short-subunit alcohol dehydrogenase family)